MGRPNFTIPGSGATITLPTGKAFVILAAIVTIGTLGCVAMVLAAFLAVAYLLNLTISALSELVTHIADVYVHSDSFAKILVWFLVGYVLIKLWPRVQKSLLRSLRRSPSATR